MAGDDLEGWANNPALAGFRHPPHNVEAEKAVLGAIFANNHAYHAVAELLKPEHFALAQNGRVFEACGRLIDRGRPADPVTLKAFFERNAALGEIGGIAYLADLAGSAVGIINAREYASLVHEMYVKRRLIDAGEAIANLGWDDAPDLTSGEMIGRAEAELLDVAADGVAREAADLGGSVNAALKGIEAIGKNRGKEPPRPMTGLADLDRLLGGLWPGTLVVLAGRPSMGKSAKALGIARHVGEVQGMQVDFYSLEDSAENLIQRLLSDVTGIELQRIRTGDIAAAEWQSLIEAGRRIKGWPLHIDDRDTLSAAGLRAAVLRRCRTAGTRLVIVDYLQLMEPEDRYKGQRVQEVSAITRSLKLTAKAAGIPIILLSQLSRQVEQRDDRRPRMSDLRESGSIEQDADDVVLLFREEYYVDPNAPPAQREREKDDAYAERVAKWQLHLIDIKNKAEAIVAKHRHGPTGSVPLYFDGPRARFRNWGGSGDAPAETQAGLDLQ